MEIRGAVFGVVVLFLVSEAVFVEVLVKEKEAWIVGFVVFVFAVKTVVHEKMTRKTESSKFPITNES